MIGNIWLFLSTRSLGNSSISKNNHKKWIREELHVFFTPSCCSFKRRISRSRPSNVARGFESLRRRHMWVEFVVGSLPCSERFFSRYFGCPLSFKTNTFKFQFDLERTDTFQRVLKTPKCSVEAGDFYHQKDQPSVHFSARKHSCMDSTNFPFE